MFFSGVLSVDNMALNQPAWAPYDSPQDPARKAVDGNLVTFGYTGHSPNAFLAVDIGSLDIIGTISLNFDRCKY